jgi:tryptophan synthase alpha chain
MGRIEEKFKVLKERGEKALVIYLTAGYPSLNATREMIGALDKAGVDIVELGVPFSDPTADGPIIQAASQKALKAGTTLEAVLDLVSEVRKTSEIPIVLFGYYNPIFAYGNEKFSKKAAEVGIDGILIVDLPFEEARELRCFTDPKGIDFISLVAPTTGEERIRQITNAATGFLYYVSITGVTGTLKPVIEDIRRGVDQIRKVSSLPVAIGFGISTPAQAGEIAPLGDGIVVGSALMKVIEEGQKKGALIDSISSFVKDLKKAMDSSKLHV